MRTPCLLGAVQHDRDGLAGARRGGEGGAVAVCYDAGGPGAGVRGTWDTAEGLPFEAQAVQFGESPGDDVWPDGQTSKQKCLNLRAEMYWKLRARFERAYEFREKKIQHPPDEMISIPDHPQLIAELSMPLAQRTSSGKIKLESKDDMRRRGLKSPNYADALAMAFHAKGRQFILGGLDGVFSFGGKRAWHGQW